MSYPVNDVMSVIRAEVVTACVICRQCRVFAVEIEQGWFARQRPRPTLPPPRLHLPLGCQMVSTTALKNQNCHHPKRWVARQEVVTQKIWDVRTSVQSGLSCTNENLRTFSATLAVNRLGRRRATRPRATEVAHVIKATANHSATIRDQ